MEFARADSMVRTCELHGVPCAPGFGAACGPIERSCGGYETSLPSDPQFIVELLTGGVGVVGATSPDGFGLSLVRDRSR
jgi:hypothetical protein